MKSVGYGAGYQYAHDLDEKVADMQCLPDNLKDRVYYHPTEEGIEKRIKARLEEIKKLRTSSPQRHRDTRRSRSKTRSQIERVRRIECSVRSVSSVVNFEAKPVLCLNFSVPLCLCGECSHPPPMLLQNAPIHHHEDPRRPRLLRRFFVHHAFLHPDRRNS